MLFMVVSDSDKDFVVRAILDNAKSGTEGKFGDGKIFVSAVEEVYTISTGERESEPTLVAQEA
jgi:nitrogen regulatory protein PII 1